MPWFRTHDGRAGLKEVYGLIDTVGDAAGSRSDPAAPVRQGRWRLVLGAGHRRSLRPRCSNGLLAKQSPPDAPTSPGVVRCPLGGGQPASRSACLPASRSLNAATISLAPKKIAHTPTRVTSVTSDRCQERTAHTPSTSSAAPSSSPLHQ
jgi:hypothetical protein